MNPSEIIEQKLNEAQHRRNQVLSILNSVPDATRPNQPKSSFSVTSSDLNNNNSRVFEGDDRSQTNLYRVQRYQAPPPLCDVSALRVDDLVTAFLRFRRSLHHLCYHGQSSMSMMMGDGSYRGGDNNNSTSSSLAVHQLSEVGILQQRIDKIRFECFMMLEQLRDSAVNGAVSVDTTELMMMVGGGGGSMNTTNNNSNNNNSIQLIEAPEVTILKNSIKEEKAKLKEALARLTIANYVPQ